MATTIHSKTSAPRLLAPSEGKRNENRIQPRWFLSLGLFVFLALGCSSGGSPGEAGADGSSGSTATRAQSCATIEQGAAVVMANTLAESGAAAGSGGASGSGGTAGGGAPSVCEALYSGCTDADVAAVAPQYACFSAHSTNTVAEIQAACPLSTTLSDACESAITTAVPPPSKAFASPGDCIQFSQCSRDIGPQPACQIACFLLWWALS
jgi:hypothetical protein